MLAEVLPLIIFILFFISPKQAIAQDEYPIDSYKYLCRFGGEPFALPSWYDENGKELQLLKGVIGKLDTEYLDWAYINPVPFSRDEYKTTAEIKVLNFNESHCFLRPGNKVKIIDGFFSWKSWYMSIFKELAGLFYQDIYDFYKEMPYFAYVSAPDIRCGSITYLLKFERCELVKDEGRFKVKVSVSTVNENEEQQKGVLVQLL